MCLLASRVFSLEKCLFKAFAHFFLSFFFFCLTLPIFKLCCFLLWSCKSSLYILNPSLYQKDDLQIFSAFISSLYLSLHFLALVI